MTKVRNPMHLPHFYFAILAALLATSASGADPWQTGSFQWQCSQPLLGVAADSGTEDPAVAIKDPTVVFHQGRWHVLTTLRKKSGKVMMEQLSFTDWQSTSAATRSVVELHDAYHCAPQVFWHSQQQRWYLIYQMTDKTQQPPRLAPCFSTTTDLADARSWSKPQIMVDNPADKQRWIDFWVICDATKAHLFYTSNDGHLWRRETSLADFPFHWSEQKLALKADIFEASHTYKLKGRDLYLTLIEAQAPGRRYYKAYLADRLDGEWRGLADSLDKPFAARENIAHPTPLWADSISHGELLRSGIDERMEIAPEHLRFLFQGVTDAGYKTKYGSIPWQLGLLEQVR